MSLFYSFLQSWILQRAAVVFTLEKLVLNEEMKREKRVLLRFYCWGPPHFMCLNVADVALRGWHVWGLYLWVSLWEREYRVQDRHGKGIRQMCCCVWVDQVSGFYCCFSRGPLGSLNLSVKFWESQGKSATFPLSLSHQHSVTSSLMCRLVLPDFPVFIIIYSIMYLHLNKFLCQLDMWRAVYCLERLDYMHNLKGELKTNKKKTNTSITWICACRLENRTVWFKWTMKTMPEFVDTKSVRV